MLYSCEHLGAETENESMDSSEGVNIGEGGVSIGSSKKLELALFSLEDGSMEEWRAATLYPPSI